MSTFLAAWQNFLSSLIHPIELSPERLKRAKFISIAMIAGLVIGFNIYPGSGFDWYCCWSDYVTRPTTNQFPTWLYLVISPIATLPNAWQWFNGFSSIVMVGVILLADFAAPWTILLLPVVWIFIYGQVDNWVALGAVLGLYAMKKNNPYLGGAAAFLLTAKPHLGLALSLFYLWKFRSWKMFLIPGIVLLISFAAFGFWPIPYFQNILTNGVTHLIRDRVNISLFPWSLALLPILVLYWKKRSPRRQAIAIYSMTCLIIPYCPVYSVIPLLFMVNMPLLPMLLIPACFGFNFSVIFGAIYAIACMVYALFWPEPDTSFDQKAGVLQSKGEPSLIG